MSHNTKYILLIALLFLIAAAIRFALIDFEPLWIDERYSMKFSGGPIATAIEGTARDDHPPLYYLGLRVWRTIAGETATGLRSYSVFWSLIGLLAVFLFARDLGGRTLAGFALLLGAFNPHDVYFAQEARMYIQAAALCMLASWCLWRWMVAGGGREAPARRWWPWALAYFALSIAALYTLYLTVMVLVAQGLFALVAFLARRRWANAGAYSAIGLVAGLAFLPWVLHVVHLRGSLLNPALTWIPIPHWTDYFSFIGKEFTTGHFKLLQDVGWEGMTALWVFLFTCVVIVRLRRAESIREVLSARSGLGYLAWLVAGPVLLAALAVALYHPIYFRPRFSILVLHPFLILAAMVFAARRHGRMIWADVVVIVVLMLPWLYFQQITIQKLSWERLKTAWPDGPPMHVAWFPRALHSSARYHFNFFETYRIEPKEIDNLAKLDGEKIWLVCAAGYRFNGKPVERRFYESLHSIGSVYGAALSESLRLEVVTVGSETIGDGMGHDFSEVYQTIDVPDRVEGFQDPQQFDFLESRDSDGAPFRWSRTKVVLQLPDTAGISTVTLNVAFPPPLPANYRPNLQVYFARNVTPETLFATPPIKTIEQYRPGTLSIALPVPEGNGPLRLGWTLSGVMPAMHGIPGDPRILGLQVFWIAFEM